MQLLATKYTMVAAVWLLGSRRTFQTLAYSPIRSSVSSFHSTTAAAFGWRIKQKNKMRALKMSAVENQITVGDLEKKMEWDIPGLKKETERNVLRCFKKVQKASSKLNKAMKTLEELTASESATLEDLEKCPDVDAFQAELDTFKARLQQLNELEVLLEPLKKSTNELPEEARLLAIELGIDDKAPPRAPRGPGKAKGPRSSEKSRLPYRRYYSKDKIEIRVGKQAEDNDELSTNPKYRDGNDWWMHAAGCPGSHVVIRTGAQNIDDEIILDAASLAARQSKCNGAIIKVSMTRCRNVSKPAGTKAGLVRLNGDIRTISVNMKDAQKRLDRLDETVLVN